MRREESGYRTPEEAAVASYSDAAGAFVVRVDRRRNWAEVEIDTDPSHPYFVRCERKKDGLWYVRGGNN
jgi:hypothetical protein